MTIGEEPPENECLRLFKEKEALNYYKTVTGKFFIRDMWMQGKNYPNKLLFVCKPSFRGVNFEYITIFFRID